MTGEKKRKMRKAKRREECERAISEECSLAYYVCVRSVHQLQFEILTLLANRGKKHLFTNLME